MSRCPFVHIFMVTVHSLTRSLCYSSVHWYAINHAGLLPLSFGAFAPLASLEKVLIVIKPCNLPLYVAITDISMGTFSFYFFSIQSPIIIGPMAVDGLHFLSQLLHDLTLLLSVSLISVSPRHSQIVLSFFSSSC